MISPIFQGILWKNLASGTAFGWGVDYATSILMKTYYIHLRHLQIDATMINIHSSPSSLIRGNCHRKVFGQWSPSTLNARDRDVTSFWYTDVTNISPFNGLRLTPDSFCVTTSNKGGGVGDDNLLLLVFPAVAVRTVSPAITENKENDTPLWFGHIDAVSPLPSCAAKLTDNSN